MEQAKYPIVDSVEKLEETLAKVREAERKFSTYTQEQVDAIFKAAAIAANKARIPLAKMAVEETGMGVVEDKVIKNNYAAEYIYNAYKNTKTCGVIEEDKAFGIKKVAEPLGVIAAVIPTTNPTSTAIFKTLIALKTRNGIIISPHPRAKKSTTAAARIVLEAAVEAGAPENIIAWIDIPNLEMTNLLMKEADVILATGGPGMVKSAYSSGKPALGVGAGNTPAIIDDTADIVLAVNSIIHSKTFDNGMICASEQSVIVHKNVYDAVRKEFAYRNCYFLKGDELDKVRKTIIINGALNARGFEGLGDTGALGSFYRETVCHFEDVNSLYDHIQKTYGKDFDAAMDFLYKALASDLAADVPSMETSHLEHVNGSLGELRQLQSARSLCARLLERWSSVHGIRHCPLDDMTLLGKVLDLRKERYISGNHISRLAEEAGAPDIERKVLFLQELLNTARSFAPSLFDGNEGRMKVLDAVQDAVDAAIAEEDAWLAEQG